MRKIYYFFISGIILFNISKDLHSQWVTQTTPFTTHYYTLFFLDPNTGWAAGDGFKVIKTTNGGTNWIHISTPDGNDRGEAMHFVDENTGFVGTYLGKVYRTNNGGVNWSAVTLQNNSRIFSFDFINKDTGWVAGEGMIYFKTTNRGLSWFKPSVSLDNMYKTDVNFINGTTGFVTGPNNARIMKSISGGNGWVGVQVPGYPLNGFPWMGTSFINDNTGWAVGLRGYVAKTTNAGDNWNIISMDTTFFYGWYSDVKFLNDTLGYASVVNSVSGGSVHMTTNGGVNWAPIPGLIVWDFCDEMTFPNDSVVYTGGGGGYIYKTDNALLTGISNTSGTIPGSFRLFQNYPNPFNPSTVIKFDLVSSGNTQLILYNSLGQKINTLISEKMSAGTYEYSFNGSNLSSGIYYYSLTSGNITQTKRMILLK